MNKFIRGLAFFAVGAIVGGLVTKKYMEKALEIRAMEEEEEEMNVPEYTETEEDDDDDRDMTFKEYYEGETGRPLTRNTASRSDKKEYEKIRVRYDTLMQSIAETNEKAAHYNDDVEPFSAHPNYNGQATPQPETIIHDPNVPYFISEEEWGVLEGWDGDEYTLFNDGYITDVYGMPIDERDTDELFGVGFHKKFEQEGKDQVWIRNERLKTDISIIKDLDNFEEVAPLKVKRAMGWA